jgi:hypothetical protein
MDNPYKVGDRVLASRAQDGENHEDAKVVDAYSLIIGGEERPMVVVEFPDGPRAWVTANGPDVMPAPEADDEAEEGEEPGEAAEDSEG